MRRTMAEFDPNDKRAPLKSVSFDTMRSTGPVPVALSGSNGTGEFQIPQGIPRDTLYMLAEVLQRPVIRDQELVRLKDLHDCPCDLRHNEKYYPKPEIISPAQWEMYLKVWVPVNLIKPAVRRIVASVYGGNVYRRVENAPAILNEALSTNGRYGADVRCWFEGATWSGTSVRAWTLNQFGKLETWLPNPITTHLYSSPDNIRNLRGVFEYACDGAVLRFMTDEGQGVLYKGRPGKWMTTDWGFLPATVGYGQDRRHLGDIYGLSLVREAADYTLRATDATLNLGILQKAQTKALLVVADDNPEEDTVAEAFAGTGFIKTSKDGKVYYVSPDGKFKEILDVLNHYMSMVSMILSIPRDTLDAMGGESNASAEGARLRAIPLTSMTRFLIEEWRSNEIDSALRGAALVRWTENGNSPVNMADVAKEVPVDIQIESASIPEGRAEEISADIQLMLNGIKSPYDTVKKHNSTKPEPAVEKQVEWIEANLMSLIESGKGTAALAQKQMQEESKLETALSGKSGY